MRIAFTHYPRGAETTVWYDNFPQVPRPGDTVHLERAWEVWKVSWVPDIEPEDGGILPADTSWHLEVSLR